MRFYAFYVILYFNVFLYIFMFLCTDQLPPISPVTKSSMASTRFPQISKPAPEFSGTAVVNGSFKEISLKDYRGKYVVLFFYPLDLYVMGDDIH